MIFAVCAACAQGPQNRMTFSGYGELHYNELSDDVAVLDLHRLVIGFGYRFNDRISFAAEIDFEHAFTEPEVEFAYVDFFKYDALSFRGGMMLMPVGPLNEFHEPPFYYSVERPYLQKYVVPTTWSEPGAGIFGTLLDGSVGYRAYVVGGLNAFWFRSSDGIRKGRQKGAAAKAEDLAGVARLEWSPSLRLTLGASGYGGMAAQGEAGLGDAAVALGEVDAVIKMVGFEVRGVYAHTLVDGADSISTNNSTGSAVGKVIVGWNAEVAYHLFKGFWPGSQQDVVLFARIEDFDTQHKAPDGFARDPKWHREVLTAGVSYMPIPEVAIKVDAERWRNGAGQKWERYNVGIAWMFAQ